MRSLDRVRRYLRPRETRFFLAISAWGWSSSIVYWLVSYELVGTLLLAGVGFATGTIALRFTLLQRHRSAADAERDRPFDDPMKSIPGESMAPFGTALSIALLALATILGPAFLLVGLIGLVWSGWFWIRGASAELDVVGRAERRKRPR